MPNYITHARAGAAAGAVTAAYRARALPTDQLVAEVVGGMIGGWAGGVLPDVLEPATSPNHRQIAHSAVTGGALFFARLTEWQADCRASAEAANERLRVCQPGSDEHSRAQWEVLFWRLLAGALVGLVAGYASHLALDAATPRGLPLLGA